MYPHKSKLRHFTYSRSGEGYHGIPFLNKSETAHSRFKNKRVPPSAHCVPSIILICRALPHFYRTAPMNFTQDYKTITKRSRTPTGIKSSVPSKEERFKYAEQHPVAATLQKFHCMGGPSPTRRTLPLLWVQLADSPELSPSAFPAEEPGIAKNIHTQQRLVNHCN